MTNKFKKSIILASLGVVLFMIVSFVLVVYLVSPLRDPSFVQTPYNATATVSWLASEKYWTNATGVLSVALATNVALLIWSQNQWHIMRKPVMTTLQYLGLGMLWFGIFYVSLYLSLLFILWQHVFD